MKRNDTLLPRRILVPLAITVGINMLAFYGTRLLNGGMTHYDLTTAADRAIPFVPAAVLVYILAFLSWAIGFAVILREDSGLCFRFMAGEQIGKLLCLVIFLVLPTVMTRPAVPGDDVFSWITRFIYAMDTPDNLFPSVHCFENWVLFRGALRCRKVGRAYKVGYFIFTLMVFASTLLVKQHLIADVLAGVVVAELGLWLADRLKAWRIYEAMARKWNWCV